MTPSDIPLPYEYIQPNVNRGMGIDEVMEFKYGVGSETGGKKMNLGRGALYAFLLGILLIAVPGLVGSVYSPILGFVRETFSIGNTYYAVQGFLNFVTGGLLNLVAFELFAVAAILLGLRGREPRIISTFPRGGPSSRVQG